MSTLEVLFILPNTPEPRNENIINLIKNEYKTGVMFWKKNPEQASYHLDGSIVFEIPVKADAYNPLNRIFPMFSYFKRAIRNLKELQPKCVHVSKLDSMLIVWYYKKLARRKPSVVYDISDLHELAYNDLKDIKHVVIRRIIRHLEKMVSKQVDYILITSPKYFDEYYLDFYKPNQIIIIPNAPNIYYFDGFKKKNSGIFTIGFIGSLRYYNQLTNLIDAASELGLKVLIAGFGEIENKLKHYAMGKNNIKFYGRYDYVSEIKHLYEQIDCVYALYDTSIKNSHVALPNKLYEGAYCKLPFIVSKGVYLAEIVEEYGIGIAVEDGDVKALEKAIKIIMEIPERQIVNGCQRFSHDNDIRISGKNLIDLYHRIMC